MWVGRLAGVKWFVDGSWPVPTVVAVLDGTEGTEVAEREMDAGDAEEREALLSSSSLGLRSNEISTLVVWKDLVGE